MTWLRDQVIGFPGVLAAELGEDERGRDTLIVKLGGQQTAQSSSDPLQTLLHADIAPMLIFDAETLEIAGASKKAARVFELEFEGAGYSLADLFIPSELERLGRRLAAGADDWSDGDDWVMLTMKGQQITVHNWYAPSTAGRHRLLISLPAVDL